jgi:hypothetical protein
MSEPEGVIPPERLRVMQIVAGALVAGVLIFLAVVLFLVHVQRNGQGMGRPQELPIITLVALVMLASNAPLSFVLPRAQARMALRQIAAGTWQAPPQGTADQFATTTGRLLAVRQTTLIVSLALLEGAAFLGTIAYLLEANPLALVVVLLAVLLMLWQFPTEGRVQGWLDRQQEQLAAFRQGIG